MHRDEIIKELREIMSLMNSSTLTQEVWDKIGTTIGEILQLEEIINDVYDRET